MIINTNLASVNTLREMSVNEKSTQASMAKLSSGLKINSAADDAAGLSISEKMRGQISGLNQASTNAQTGISLVSTAEGALNESTAVLQRMRELAVEASNDTNTTSDRTAMQTETVALASTIDDIGNQTQFNTKNLLDGSVGVQTSSTNAGIVANTSVNTKSGDYSVAINAVATQAVTTPVTAFQAAASDGTLSLNGSDISISTTDTIGDVAAKINNQSGSTGVTAIIQANSGGGQNLVLQSQAYGSAATITATDGSSAGALLGSLGLGDGTATSVSAAGTDVAGTIDGKDAVGTGLQLNQLTDGTSTGSASGLSVNTVTTDTASNATITAPSLANDLQGIADNDTLVINGYTMTFNTTPTGTGSFALPTSADDLVSDINSITKDTGVTAAKDSVSGNVTLTTVAQGNHASLVIDGTQSSGNLTNDLNAGLQSGSDNLATTDVGTPADVNVNTGNTLSLQIGANQSQTMSVGIDDMRAKALGVDKIDLTTTAGAEQAITTIDNATAKVSAERSKLGAAQNRLEHTMNNLGTSSQNVTTAEANIRDVDMASEMTNFTKNNILQQASQAILSQANQQGQGVLQLLR